MYIMKKVYKTPQTAAVKLLGTNSIMVGSITETFISVHDGSSAPTGPMQ